MWTNFSEKGKTESGREVKEPVAVLGEVIGESINSFKYFIARNIGSIGSLVQMSIPYICMLGFKRTEQGLIWFIIPLIMYYVSYILRKVNMVYNNRTMDNIPIPYKRFTKVDTDGDVLVDRKRLEEMLLYMRELEDSLERLGKL